MRFHRSSISVRARAISSGRRANSYAGQTAAEFALVASIILMVIFTIMDFARLFFVQEHVQQAVQSAARYASTGNHQSGTNPQTNQPYTRTQSIQGYIQQQAAVAITMGASLSSAQITSQYGGNGSAGGPQDIEIISVTTTLPLMTPWVAPFFSNGQYTFTSTASVKNEPFPPGQTN